MADTPNKTDQQEILEQKKLVEMKKKMEEEFKQKLKAEKRQLIEKIVDRVPSLENQKLMDMLSDDDSPVDDEIVLTGFTRNGQTLFRSGDGYIWNEAGERIGFSHTDSRSGERKEYYYHELIVEEVDRSLSSVFKQTHSQ